MENPDPNLGAPGGPSGAIDDHSQVKDTITVECPKLNGVLFTGTIFGTKTFTIFISIM